jgi:hypothetical protein
MLNGLVVVLSSSLACPKNLENPCNKRDLTQINIVSLSLLRFSLWKHLDQSSGNIGVG